MFPPKRIIYLTDETVETGHRLGDRTASSASAAIACVLPRRAAANRGSPPSPRRTSRKILGLRPDLALSFSDLQADIVAALIQQGVAIYAFTSARLPRSST
jgi:iron complex transport system substrate-binding protein